VMSSGADAAMDGVVIDYLAECHSINKLDELLPWNLPGGRFKRAG
jgi:hypothetical protein